MCNLYAQQVAWQAYTEMMQRAALDIPVSASALDLQYRPEIRITDLSAVMVMPSPGVVDLQLMSFSYPSDNGRGPVFNVRSEGRDYSRSHRCIVPASAFFEFTAPADPKQKRKDRWRFTRTDGDWMGLPALWKPAEGNKPSGFALPTVDPGPDVGAIHARQIVVLEPGLWRGWLEGGDKTGFGPLPAGTLQCDAAPT